MKKISVAAIARLMVCGLVCYAVAGQAAWWNRSASQTKQPDTAAAAQTATTTATADAKYPSLTSAQVKDIQQIVRDELVANPQTLVKASHALQKQQQAISAQVAQRAISDNAQQLFADPNSPMAGNLQGSVTLVEFFDYQCGHCKTASQAVEQLIQANPELKVIYKELPIFGANSKLASEAALAANIQHQYQAFHDALFASPAGLSPESIAAIAKSLNVNIDPTQLTTAQQTQIQQQLQQNKQLAQALQLRGTPAFVISNQDHSKSTLIPGAVPLSTLQAVVDQMKAAPSNTTAQSAGAPATGAPTPAAGASAPAAGAPTPATGAPAPAAGASASATGAPAPAAGASAPATGAPAPATGAPAPATGAPAAGTPAAGSAPAPTPAS